MRRRQQVQQTLLFLGLWLERCWALCWPLPPEVSTAEQLQPEWVLWAALLVRVWKVKEIREPLSIVVYLAVATVFCSKGF
jgi:hypothetical protein